MDGNPNLDSWVSIMDARAWKRLGLGFEWFAMILSMIFCARERRSSASVSASVLGGSSDPGASADCWESGTGSMRGGRRLKQEASFLGFCSSCSSVPLRLCGFLQKEKKEKVEWIYIYTREADRDRERERENARSIESVRTLKTTS